MIVFSSRGGGTRGNGYFAGSRGSRNPPAIEWCLASPPSGESESLARRPNACQARGREEPECTRQYMRIPSGRAATQTGPAAALRSPLVDVLPVFVLQPV